MLSAALLLALQDAPVLMVPAQPEQPEIYETREEWRVAAQRWSAKVMLRATSMYQGGPVQKGVQGVVKVRFKIADDGTTNSCHTYASSGAEALDQIGCKAVAAAGLAPVLKQDDESEALTWIVLPVRFVLRDDFLTE